MGNSEASAAGSRPAAPSPDRRRPRHLGSLAPQLGERGVDVVAHQVELVTAITVGRDELLFGRIHGHLRGHRGLHRRTFWGARRPVRPSGGGGHDRAAVRAAAAPRPAVPTASCTAGGARAVRDRRLRRGHSRQLDLTEAVDKWFGSLAARPGPTGLRQWNPGRDAAAPAEARWPPVTPSPPSRLGPDGGSPSRASRVQRRPVKHGGELLGALSLQNRGTSRRQHEDELFRTWGRRPASSCATRRSRPSWAGHHRRSAGVAAAAVQAQDTDDDSSEPTTAPSSSSSRSPSSSACGDPWDPGEVRQLGGPTAVRGCMRPWMICVPWPGDLPAAAGRPGTGRRRTRASRKAPLPVGIEADGIGRYPREAKAAAYFCILEALQTIAKYARASRPRVTLTCPDGHPGSTVTDDGDGFDTAKATHGTGLQGMADRLAAAAHPPHPSAPGSGTTISGTLPVAAKRNKFVELGTSADAYRTVDNPGTGETITFRRRDVGGQWRRTRSSR